jgi:hypothetical protein
MDLVAFVYMPEHLHLLVYPTLPDPAIDRYLARIKQPFSKEIKGMLVSSDSSLIKKLTVRERPGKYCFRFWQEGPGFDRTFSRLKRFRHASITFIAIPPAAAYAAEQSIGNGPVLDITWLIRRSKIRIARTFMACHQERWMMEHNRRGPNGSPYWEFDGRRHWQSQWHTPGPPAIRSGISATRPPRSPRAGDRCSCTAVQAVWTAVARHRFGSTEPSRKRMPEASRRMRLQR